MSRIKTSVIWTMPREEFVKLVKNNSSIASILRKLQFAVTGKGHKMIRDRCAAEGVNIEHIKRGTSSNTGRKFEGRLKKPLAEVMTKNSTYSTKNLKSRLLKEGSLENKCYICGQLPFWNGKGLVLRIDHINGVRNDNRKENLRIVCPHCDSQLPTFSGRNTARYSSEKMRKANPVKLCSECKHAICSKNKSGMCRKCFEKHKKSNPLLYGKVKWPSKESLEQMITNEPMTAIAKKLGVSDTAVKKRAKAYGITLHNRRGYWSKEKKIPSKSAIEKALYEFPIRKMAKKFEVSVGLIRRWIKKYGLKSPGIRYWALKSWEKRKQINRKKFPI